MFQRTLALAAAGLFSLAAVAGAQTQPAAPAASPPPAAAPAAAPPAGAPPAGMPPAAAPPAAAAPSTAMPPAAAPVVAPAAPPVRIRGTIAAVAPHLLTVTTRDGKVEVVLTDPLTVATLKRVPLASIKDGAYLGIASRPGPHGTQVALEVLVFPESMRGAGAGHYAWDLQPNSMMTNAPVTGVASEKSGRNLTLTYQGGKVVIHVPSRAPVVTFAPASVADLKPGRKVFIVAHKDAEGHLAAPRVTVGTHRVNPPM
jgi:hypothetical protein